MSQVTQPSLFTNVLPISLRVLRRPHRVGKILIYVSNDCRKLHNLGTNCFIHRWEFGTKQSSFINLRTMFHLQLRTRNDDFSVLHYSEPFAPTL